MLPHSRDFLVKIMSHDLPEEDLPLAKHVPCVKESDNGTKKIELGGFKTNFDPSVLTT